jgi:cytochrome c-type biogenesis protein CcmH
MRALRAALFALLLGLMPAVPVLAPGPAIAIGANEALEDPEQEARARALFKELRCLVCQNQSIDDSDADLARDLRVLVRERIRAGDSDQEVLAFLTSRYGDFVLLRPPVRPSTWPLWFGPFALLAAAALGLAWALRRRRARSGGAPQPLTAEERARLDALLEDGEERR